MNVRGARNVKVERNAKVERDTCGGVYTVERRVEGCVAVLAGCSSWCCRSPCAVGVYRSSVWASLENHSRCRPWRAGLLRSLLRFFTAGPETPIGSSSLEGRYRPRSTSLAHWGTAISTWRRLWMRVKCSCVSPNGMPVLLAGSTPCPTVATLQGRSTSCQHAGGELGMVRIQAMRSQRGAGPT
jgi:hypothetical protein